MKRLLALLLSLCLFVGASACADTLFPETESLSIFAKMSQFLEPGNTLLTDEMQKLTNTKIDFQWIPSASFTEKLSAVVASGKLPDVIIAPAANIPMLVEQGVIIPLDDLIAQHAPDYLSYLTEDDKVMLKQASDGKTYGVARIFDFPYAMSTIIREDWLKNVGKEAPTTWEEWLDVLRAFRDRDPNGDGAANEIPLTFFDMGHMLNIFGIKSTADDVFCVTDDGQYTLVSEHPAYKDFLEGMRLLYSEKLINQEYQTVVMNSAYQQMNDNLAGAIIAWAQECRTFTTTNRATIPDAKAVCVPPIMGPAGTQLIPARAKLDVQYCITVAGEAKAEKLIKLVNWFFTEEGIKLWNYGIEGVHHEVKDGKPAIVAPHVDNFVNAYGAGLFLNSFPIYWAADAYEQVMCSGLDRSELDELNQEFVKGLFLNEEYFYVQMPTFATEAYIEYQADLLPKVAQIRDEYITGKIDMATYDAEYQELLDGGLDEVIKQAGEIYSSLK